MVCSTTVSQRRAAMTEWLKTDEQSASSTYSTITSQPQILEAFWPRFPHTTSSVPSSGPQCPLFTADFGSGQSCRPWLLFKLASWREGAGPLIPSFPEGLGKQSQPLSFQGSLRGKSSSSHYQVHPLCTNRVTWATSLNNKYLLPSDLYLYLHICRSWH